MLNVFRGKKSNPNYRLVAPPNGDLQTITVLEEVEKPGIHVSTVDSKAKYCFRHRGYDLMFLAPFYGT